MQFFKKIMERINRFASLPTDDQARYDFMKEMCDGFFDPEERCPRHPSKCVCYPIRQKIEKIPH